MAQHKLLLYFFNLKRIFPLWFFALQTFSVDSFALSCNDFLSTTSVSSRFADRIKLSQGFVTLRISPRNASNWDFRAHDQQQGASGLVSALRSYFDQIRRSKYPNLNVITGPEMVNINGIVESRALYSDVIFGSAPIKTHQSANTIEFNLRSNVDKIQKIVFFVSVEDPKNPEVMHQLESPPINLKPNLDSTNFMSDNFSIGWDEFSISGEDFLPKELSFLGELKIKSIGLRFFPTHEDVDTNVDIDLLGHISFTSNLLKQISLRQKQFTDPSYNRFLLTALDILYVSNPNIYISDYIKALAQAYYDLDPNYKVTVPLRNSYLRTVENVDFNHSDILDHFNRYHPAIDSSPFLSLVKHPLADRLHETSTNLFEVILQVQQTAFDLVSRLYDKDVQAFYLRILKQEGPQGIIKRVRDLGFKIAVQPPRQSLRSIWNQSLEGVVGDVNFTRLKRVGKTPDKIILFDPNSMEHGPLSHLLQLLTLYHEASNSEVLYLDQLFLNIRTSEGYFLNIWHFLFDGPGTNFPNSPDYWQKKALEIGVSIDEEEYVLIGHEIEEYNEANK